jgi:hypothetical protein
MPRIGGGYASDRGATDCGDEKRASAALERTLPLRQGRGRLELFAMVIALR